MSALRIGCSGWTYPHWAGLFYPAGAKDRDRLAYYATRFDTTEINGSFYRVPSAAAVENWRTRTPARFVFAWKLSRFITHNKKLKDCEESVAFIFGRMAALGGKLGPALIQTPPMLRRDDARLDAFLQMLPKHRCAFEFRDASWYAPAVFKLLAEHDAALCISDHHAAPAPWEVTASWVYVRGHGPQGAYSGRYSKTALKRWADHIAAWRTDGLDVYAYFDNDVKAAAPHDAAALLRLTGEPAYAENHPRRIAS